MSNNKFVTNKILDYSGSPADGALTVMFNDLAVPSGNELVIHYISVCADTIITMFPLTMSILDNRGNPIPDISTIKIGSHTNDIDIHEYPIILEGGKSYDISILHNQGGAQPFVCTLFCCLRGV